MHNNALLCIVIQYYFNTSEVGPPYAWIIHPQVWLNIVLWTCMEPNMASPEQQRDQGPCHLVQDPGTLILPRAHAQDYFCMTFVHMHFNIAHVSFNGGASLLWRGLPLLSRCVPN